MAARKRAASRKKPASLKKRALTRKVTRGEALSYNKTVPNKRGVTALSEINGPDAYRRRYRATKELLSRGRRGASARRPEEKAMARARYTPGQTRAMKGMTAARRAGFKKRLAHSPSIETIRPRKRRARTAAKPTRRAVAPKAKRRTRASQPTRRARPNRAVVPGREAQAAYGVGFARAFGHKPTRPKKADFVRSQMARGRSKKQADAAWKISWGKKASAAQKQRARKPRTYGAGRYRALKARIGSKSRPTYMYRTRKGAVRHIPEHAVLGYPSARALTLARKTAKGEASYQKKKSRLGSRRSRAADRSAGRILAGKGIFAPNPGEEVLSFEEWKEMYKLNKRKKTRKKGKKKTKAQLHAIRVRAGKKGARIKAAKKGRRSAAAKKRKPTTKRRKVTAKRKTTAKRRTTKRRSKLTKAQRSAAAKKGWARRRRAGTAKRRPPRPATKRRKARRAKSLTITMRANASPRQVAAARRNIKKAQRARWRSNSAMRYEANPADAFVADMKGAVKIGAIVLTGYMAHRALTKMLADYGLSKVGAFQSGGLGRWRDVIAGMLVAVAGVPLAVKVVPRESAAAGAGIAASLLHQIVVSALTEAGQANVVAYLSAYPDASSPAWPGLSSYYTFQPRQIYPASGMGEYYGLGPGPLQTDQLTQAAAGYQPMQAAAGMGALVTQAAAGEYLVHGAEGFGDNYEQIPTSPVAMQIDDGVMPNLYSAEQELNVMEAAAGIGQSEIPIQSTVNPLQLETPIGDEPRGSRSGIFEGGGGIFG